MAEDNTPIPDDISSLEAELEFQQLENSIAEFNKAYDEPIDSRFLWNYIGGRQLGYGNDELQIIEDTAFSKIMDYMDENDLHYTEIDVYDFIPEDKRLSPYLIFKENMRNEYYTDDFVEYMTLVTRRTPSGIYDTKTDDILNAPPSHYMAEYALKGAHEQGPTKRFEVWAKIINGDVTDGFSKKLKFKDFFKKAYERAENRDLIIRHVNNLFPGGSYEAFLEENHNRNMEKMGFTPEGDWLPEIKEKMVIKYTDVDGKVTYTDFYGKEVSPDDPRISDDSKFDDLVKQLEPSSEKLTEEQKIKKLYDDNILTETEYEQALKKEGIFADTPTNVVDDFGQKGIKWADARKALEDVNNWGEDIPILEERFIGNTNDKITLEIIPPKGNVEGLIPSEDYRLQASIVKENGDIEIIKTYDNPRQFGADGKNFFNDISSIDTPTNVVDDIVFNKSEAIDNVNNLVDELPLEETFKNQVKKNTARISKNVATPGGVIDFIDAWELGVLALAVAAISTNEVDEIPTIIYNQGVKMYNSMLSSVGIPGQVQEKPYNINFEKAIKTFNIAEMFMPTAYAEKAAVKEFKKGQEAGVDISVGLGAGAGVPPMQFKGQEPKQDNGDINNIMVNLMKNISNAQKSYPITSSEMSNFSRNPIQVVAQDTADKPVKIEYDSKEKQKINDIYAKLYKNLSNAGARVQ